MSLKNPLTSAGFVPKVSSRARFLETKGANAMLHIVVNDIHVSDKGPSINYVTRIS